VSFTEDIKMNMIEMGKAYKYRSGQPAKIVYIHDDDADTNFPVVSVDIIGCPHTHTAEGKFDDLDNKSRYDLIEVQPYEDFNIDDEVIVWINPNAKVKGHFAGVSGSGMPMIWQDGRTSFTSVGLCKSLYKYAMKSEESETIC